MHYPSSTGTGMPISLPVQTRVAAEDFQSELFAHSGTGGRRTCPSFPAYKGQLIDTGNTVYSFNRVVYAVQRCDVVRTHIVIYSPTAMIYNGYS